MLLYIFTAIFSCRGGLHERDGGAPLRPGPFPHQLPQRQEGPRQINHLLDALEVSHTVRSKPRPLNPGGYIPEIRVGFEFHVVIGIYLGHMFLFDSKGFDIRLSRFLISVCNVDMFFFFFFFFFLRKKSRNSNHGRKDFFISLGVVIF